MRLFLALFLASAPSVLAGTDRDIAVDYVRARCSTLSKGATVADVESVLALLSDDAVVEHPQFGAVVKGKDAIRGGLLSHLTEYTGGRDESGIVVLSSVESSGVVVFKTRTTFVVGDGEERKVIARPGVMILEVAHGRISRVLEYSD